MSMEANKKNQVSSEPKKPYSAPKFTKYGDVVEQTTRGHSGPDKNRKTH
jgi:hypothetical protein